MTTPDNKAPPREFWRVEETGEWLNSFTPLKELVPYIERSAYDAVVRERDELVRERDIYERFALVGEEMSTKSRREIFKLAADKEDLIKERDALRAELEQSKAKLNFTREEYSKENEKLRERIKELERE